MYLYYSKPESLVRVTIAGEHDPDTGKLVFAAARCSKKDSFVRKKGRSIAQSRLKGEKIFSSTMIKSDNPAEIRSAFVNGAKNIASLLENPLRVLRDGNIHVF